jgi:cytochrome P450 family 4
LEDVSQVKMTAATEVVAETSTSATSTFYFLLIPALVLYFLYWKLQRRRYVELGDKIPGPKGYPVIGNALDFLGSCLRKFKLFCVSNITFSPV